VAEQAALQLGVPMLLADAEPLVVVMWDEAGGAEFVPRTDAVSAEEYAAARSSGLVDRVTALIAFGCSFGGKRWGGWAGPDKPQYGIYYTGGAGRVWRRQFDRIHSVDTVVVLSDYSALTVPDGAVVYCDPPYAGTTGYAGHGWEPERFYRWVEELSVRCSVYVSEYAAPSHWVQVWEREHSATLSRTVTRKVTERLFKVRANDGGK